MHTTHSTLSSLVDRAITGKQRPLEFYLREQSRLPGPRANLELVNDLFVEINAWRVDVHPQLDRNGVLSRDAGAEHGYQH